MFVMLTDRNVSSSLPYSQQLRFTKWLYNPTPPLAHPYTQSHSAYLAAIQLYARSGQLPTADGLKQRKHQETNLCQMGCQTIEYIYFTICPSFTAYRLEAHRKVVADATQLPDKEDRDGSAEQEKILFFILRLLNMAIEMHTVLSRTGTPN